MSESLGQAQVEVTANLSDWQRALITMRQDWDKNFQKLEQTAQSSLGQVGGLFKGLAASAVGLGIGVVIEGIAGDLKGMALEADKASIATRVFAATIKSAGLDADAADKMVNELSARFRVMPEQVKDAVAIMARMGLSLEDIEKGLVTAGSSAKIAGANIGDSMRMAAIGFTSGRSEVFETMGIIINASEAWKLYAADIGKTIPQLTALEKAQGYIKYATKESGTEISIAADKTRTLTDSTSELENATTSLRKDIGDRLLPIVNTITEAQLEWTKTFSGLIKDSGQLGTVLGGVSGALAGLTTLAGGAALKTALASVGSLPALVSAAAASFGAFAMGGAAFVAVVGLGAVIGNLVGEINKVNDAIKQQEKAWADLEKAQGVTGAAARFATVKQQLGVLQSERETLEKEAARIARERPKPGMSETERTQQLLTDSGFSDRYKNLIVSITEATRRLQIAEQDLNRARAERAAQQNTTNRDNEADQERIEEQIRALIRLKAAGQNVTEQLKPLFKAYEQAGGNVAAFRIELEKFENELERNAEAAKKAEQAAKRLADANEKAAEEQARLNAARTNFLSGINQGESLENLAKQVLSLNARELRAKFESIEAEQQLAVTRVKSAKTLEDYTSASAAYEVAANRLAVVQDEINNRVEQGSRVMGTLFADTGRASASVATLGNSFAAAVPDIARTIASVERTQGTFLNFGDAINKLLVSGVPLTSGLLKALEDRFKGLEKPIVEVAEAFDGLTRVEFDEETVLDLDKIIASLDGFEPNALLEALDGLAKTTINPVLLSQIEALIAGLKKMREYMNLPSFGLDAGSRASPTNQLNALGQLVASQIEKPTEKGLNDLLNRAYALTTAFDVTSREAKDLAGFIAQLEKALKDLANTRERDTTGEEDAALLVLENKERLANAEAAKAQTEAEAARQALRDAQAAQEDIEILELENKERLANAEAARLQKEAEAARQALRDAQAQQEDVALLQLENRERLANAAAIKAQRDAEEALQLLRAANAAQEDTTLEDIENKERLAALALKEAQEALRLAREAQATIEDAVLMDLQNKERLAAKALEDAQEALRLARGSQARTEDAVLVDFENRERLAAAALVEAEEALRVARDARDAAEDAALMDLQNKERLEQLRLEAEALERINKALVDRQELTSTGSDTGRAALSGSVRVQRAAINGEQLSAEDLSFILADIEKALALPDTMTGLNADTRRVLEGIVVNIQNQLKVLAQARDDLRNAAAGGGAASTLAGQSQANQLQAQRQAELMAGLENSNAVLRGSEALLESGEITLEQYNARLEEQAKALDAIANNEKNLITVRAAAAQQAATLRDAMATIAKPSELGSAPDGVISKPSELGDGGSLSSKALANTRNEIALLSSEYRAGVISADAYRASLENQNAELRNLVDSGQLSTEEQRQAKIQIVENTKAIEGLNDVTKLQVQALTELETRERILQAQRDEEIKQYNETIAKIQKILQITKDFTNLLSSASNGASAGSIVNQVAGIGAGIAALIPGGQALAPIISMVGDIAGSLVDFFTAPQREAEALKKQMEGLTNSFKFFGEELAVTKTQSRGWLGDLLLGQQTVLDDVATAINTRIASSLEDAVASGISSGFSAALETGDWDKFLEGMNIELRNYLVKSFIDAFIQSESTKALLKPALDAAFAAAKTPSLEDDLLAAETLKAAYAQLGESLKPFYDALKPIYDTLTPSTNLPEEQVQNVLSRPGVAVAVGGFAQAAVVSQFEASITYFGGHVMRFGEVITRAEGYYGRLLTEGIRVVTESMPNSSGLAADLRGI